MSCWTGAHKTKNINNSRQNERQYTKQDKTDDGVVVMREKFRGSLLGWLSKIV